MITARDALRLIERAVEERGRDFRYSDYEGDWADPDVCSYRQPDGTPACIVGLALSYVGLLDKLIEDDTIVGQQASFYDEIDPEAIGVLSAAQMSQDSGEPWGEALAVAQLQAEWTP
jgi:hypothetical protein